MHGILLESNTIDICARDILGFSREICTLHELYANINICPFCEFDGWLSIEETDYMFYIQGRARVENVGFP